MRGCNICGNAIASAHHAVAYCGANCRVKAKRAADARYAASEKGRNRRHRYEVSQTGIERRRLWLSRPDVCERRKVCVETHRAKRDAQLHAVSTSSRRIAGPLNWYEAT